MAPHHQARDLANGLVIAALAGRQRGDRAGDRLHPLNPARPIPPRRASPASALGASAPLTAGGAPSAFPPHPPLAPPARPFPLVLLPYPCAPLQPLHPPFSPTDRGNPPIHPYPFPTDRAGLPPSTPTPSTATTTGLGSVWVLLTKLISP